MVNQTYENIEIIVVDDNAKNEEYRIYIEKTIKEFNDERIIYIKNEINLGGAISRNVGIKKACGKYISFLDDDDEYFLDKIEKQYKFYKENFGNGNGIIYSQSITMDEKKRKINETKTYISGNRQALYYMMQGNLATTGNLFLPKKILMEIDGFKKLDCGQEWYVVFNLLLRNYDCKYMKDILLKYYEHSQERITTNYSKKYHGEKKLYEIKKMHMKRFSKEEQKILHYRINIMLANYAIKISTREVISCLKEARKYSKINIRDILQITLKSILKENQYNFLKKKLNG